MPRGIPKQKDDRVLIRVEVPGVGMAEGRVPEGTTEIRIDEPVVGMLKARDTGREYLHALQGQLAKDGQGKKAPSMTAPLGGRQKARAKRDDPRSTWLCGQCGREQKAIQPPASCPDCGYNKFTVTEK